MPFWDDVNLSALPDLSNRLMLIESFADPPRFRLSSIGEPIRNRYDVDLSGKFVDEIDPKAPLEFISAHASATLEAKVQ
jgi:hypothetical protein